MFSSRTVVVLLAAIVGLGTVACESRITGKEGNLQFAYYGTGDPFDFNKPIAVGANLDLRVYEAPGGEDVIVLEADFDPEGVLGVEEIEGNTIVLVGEGHGRSEIRVEAELLDGEVVEDFVDMRARVASRLDLGHYCTDEDRAMYLLEQEIWLPFSLYDDNDEQLIGYGYRPVEFEPAGMAVLQEDNKYQARFHIDTGQDAGTVQISSTIDGTELELELVDADDIDGMEVKVGADPRVNHTTTIHFQPQVDGQRVCQPILNFQVENLTPDNCEVQFADNDEESSLFQELGVVVVEGRQAGECTVVGMLEDVNDGQGVSVEATVNIEP